MEDRYQREINYLRVSVTDRCNLRCRYCMPPQGVSVVPRREILSLEEITRVVEAATEVGVKKVRLTGGEPLVRRGITELVRKLAGIPEIDDIALTTNGILLAGKAGQLKAAGLCRVNISLDTLKPERFNFITRGGSLEAVWRGIEKSLEIGLHPVKLNAVVVRGFNDDEICDLARLSIKHPLHVRFIELMPFGTAAGYSREGYVPAAEIRSLIEKELGQLQEVRKLAGSGPARYYRLPGAPGTIGFISAVSDHFCGRCNRLRLTATGALRPCLFSEHEIDLKGPLRRGATRDELAGLIARAIQDKPGWHRLGQENFRTRKNMSQIGG
ncbi:cyclic pyranopterin monophosphate synthase subunit MoaA [Desulfofundulus australicus DSM 11792]|jgi:cyclic pyranopterin phosphate synthase|uniref:GTP 3',8-cyclase n=1 Tax=Desulfofundulus australicus DSM 11792 TaxID=1121425 RepID=A0A1M4T2T7_9FIRM|nr:GTP 3',8-cyclase MoaA [Desulfofundulus australicus]MDK2888021.1 3,8-cyclase [Thermoanaerobacter sp.]SHE38842.1 cyclic pyranopterin monophosphate synthase subunit MoaA [Desulfofundulus australicus DSM 11792]